MLLDDEALRMKYTPLVYTVAGTKATAINLLVSQQQIPIGVFGEEGEEAVLTFNHVDKLKSPILYDAQTNTETPLTEGMRVSVSLPSHGAISCVHSEVNKPRLKELRKWMLSLQSMFIQCNAMKSL